MRRKTIDLTLLPQMLREIIGNALESQADFIPLASDTAGGQISDAADVYVIAVENGDLDGPSVALLSRRAGSSVLALNGEATRFHTYELRFHRERYDEVSMAELVEGLRRSLARRLTED